VAIAVDSSGSTTGNSVTSLSVDITAAAVGAFCYCFIQIATAQANGVTMAGWQQLCDIDEASSSHFALYRRVKQSGDTTFTVSWANTQGAAAVWASYTGLNATYPEEGFRSAGHVASSASYTTQSVTPADNTRWALACAGARSTTGTETWTAPGALTLRTQAVNSLTRWSPACIADSNSAVTAALHNYTFTLSASEAHGGCVIAFLIPAASSNPSYPVPSINERQAVQRAATW
jgi:hypothetical protein